MNFSHVPIEPLLGTSWLCSSTIAHTYLPFAADLNDTVPSLLFTIWIVSQAPPHEPLLATIVSLPPFSAHTTLLFAIDVIYVSALLKFGLSTFSIIIDEVLSLNPPKFDVSWRRTFAPPWNPASLYNVTLYPSGTLTDESASFLIPADTIAL